MHLLAFWIYPTLSIVLRIASCCTILYSISGHPDIPALYHNEAVDCSIRTGRSPASMYHTLTRNYSAPSYILPHADFHMSFPFNQASTCTKPPTSLPASISSSSTTTPLQHPSYTHQTHVRMCKLSHKQISAPTGIHPNVYPASKSSRSPSNANPSIPNNHHDNSTPGAKYPTISNIRAAVSPAHRSLFKESRKIDMS
jgi:hypothetical protein